MIFKIIKIILFLNIVLFTFPLHGQDLSLNAGDFRIEQLSEDGFHLFIRKNPDINSVLLVESTRDPAMSSDNYAYRAAEWNHINGDEIRLLNGQPLRGLFSLVSSTIIIHPELGEAFHIYIPWIVYYGSEITRSGEVYVGDGTYFNIRTFELPYADYRGSYLDNPFELRVVQRLPERPEGRYSEEAERAFLEIADRSRGEFLYVSSPSELIGVIESILSEDKGKSVDIVICLDTTASMRPYIDGVRAMLIPMLRRIVADYTDFRIGLVFYRDYYDDYLTRVYPFTRDFSIFQRNLNLAQAVGGGDIPEAVYEALYEGAIRFNWMAESRRLILIGDAPPHPRPRGRITSDMVYQAAEERDLMVSAILLPY